MSRIAKGLVLTSAAVAAVAGTAGLASADSEAQGAALHSPGFLSGNLVQHPHHTQLNFCGNSVHTAFGLLNPAFGNKCLNG